MKVLVFHSMDNDISVSNLISSIEDRIFPEEVVLCSNPSTLREKLKQFGQRPDIARPIRFKQPGAGTVWSK